jgi:hypothetical protein
MLLNKSTKPLRINLVPTNFKKSAIKLPLISKLLEDAERYTNSTADESTKAAFIPTLQDCEAQATQL